MGGQTHTHNKFSLLQARSGTRLGGNQSKRVNYKKRFTRESNTVHEGSFSSEATSTNETILKIL